MNNHKFVYYKNEARGQEIGNHRYVRQRRIVLHYFDDKSSLHSKNDFELVDDNVYIFYLNNNLLLFTKN